MPDRDYKDILGGGALILIGAYIAIHAFTSLSIGTLTRMGPGMFPAALGIILAVLGLVIAVPGFMRAADGPISSDWRSLLAITAGILAFVFVLRPFGLVPAIVALTVVSSRADSKLSWGGTLLVAAGLSACAVLIFQVGLDLQIPIASWPW